MERITVADVLDRVEVAVTRYGAGSGAGEGAQERADDYTSPGSESRED